MALNKNALIRYKTIDKCLQNTSKEWTLNMLIAACSDALYEYEGRDIDISKRTVQLDIQMMRSDKLGYNAPIVVYDKKYYTYEEPGYSITNSALAETDLSILTESVAILKEFKDFSLFSELGGVIQRLEDKVYTEKTKNRSIIHLDKNENLKGLEYLDTLYHSIQKKLVLTLTYQSFKARKPNTFTFHPFLLKEFNNRWFLVGKTKNEAQIQTLALDRIVELKMDLKTDYLKEDFDGDEYYKNTIGVTVLPEEHLKEIVLKFDRSNAPYVLTKPFHSSQEMIERCPDGSMIFKINVHINFELIRLILGFGETVEVISPNNLRRQVKRKLTGALGRY